MRSVPEVTTRSPTTTSARSGTYLSSEVAVAAARPRDLAGDDALDAAALEQDAGAAVAVEQHLHPRGVRPGREHPSDDAGRAQDRRVERDAVDLAAIDRERAEPGHAVARHDLRRERVERQHAAQLQQLAQPHGLLRAVGLGLQLDLQLAQAGGEPAVLPVGLAVEAVARARPPETPPTTASTPCWNGARTAQHAAAAGARRRCPRPPDG